MLLSDAIEQTDCVKIPDLALTDEDLDELERCRAWKEIVRYYGQRINEVNELLEKHLELPERVVHCALAERRFARKVIDRPNMLRKNMKDASPKREQAEKEIAQLMEETRDA